MRSRIAPTPSGFLHAGNAFNFLLTERIVRETNGALLLRIDDLDVARVRPEYLEDVFKSLAWLGIQPDEGLKDRAELTEKYAQSKRLSQYDDLLGIAAERGKVFACKCSRKELAQHNDAGQYAGTCLHKNIPLDAPDVAWRIVTPQDGSVVYFDDGLAGPQHFDLWNVQRHFIIRRRDGLPAYHLASVSDDVDFGIDTIVRGADLLQSTAAQLYLAENLGLDNFGAIRFYHHPLIADRAGNKLSKSAGSSSLKALQGAGVTASSLRARFAEWAQCL